MSTSDRDPLQDVAHRHGARLALVDRAAGFHATWRELDVLAQAWARRFEASGLRPGERVAVVEPPGIRFAALLHGTMRAGGCLVPISPRAPARDVDRVLADCRPRFLVRDGDLDIRPEPAAGDPGDVCVVYTSGTSGPPKGVRLTMANHAASARGCQQALRSTSRDRWLLCLGPHHVGGLAILFRSAFSNQPVVSVGPFEAASVLEALEADRPSLVSLVPAMLMQLLDAGGLEALRAVRVLLIGGAPAPADLVLHWAALGLNACPSYGLTETCSQVAMVPPGRLADMAGSAGTVGPHATVDIVGSEIVVGGPAVSPGYLNPDLAGFLPDGRFATGDHGRLVDGVLTVTGRLDDTIITGGENVHPEEVEAVLRAHPGVRDAAVAGRPDPTWGQVVCAWVMADHDLQTVLEAWCRERLPAFKVPRRWTFVSSLPRTDGGKLRRRLLR